MDAFAPQRTGQTAQIGRDLRLHIGIRDHRVEARQFPHLRER